MGGKDRAIAYLALGADSIGAVNPDVLGNDPLISALALLELEVLLQLFFVGLAGFLAVMFKVPRYLRWQCWTDTAMIRPA